MSAANPDMGRLGAVGEVDGKNYDACDDDEDGENGAEDRGKPDQRAGAAVCEGSTSSH